MGEEIERIDHIFEISDDLFRNGRFEEFDSLLKDLKIEELSTTIIVSWLTVAAMPRRVERKEMLPSRHEFLKRCRVELTRREPDSVEALLSGLEDE